MDQKTQRQLRINVDIPVAITTVLQSAEGSIVDLTEDGALISGYSEPAGTRFQLDYMGQTIYAQCRWAEVDRMGVRFAIPLCDGPLYEWLMAARATQAASPAGKPTLAYVAALPRASERGFGRAPMLASFGRRAG